jgi:hypothetical protein
LRGRENNQQEIQMTPITKLTAVALSAMSIAGGVAVAQTAMDPKQADNPATANYSISPGSNLKRDASLSGPDKPANATSQSSTDTSRTWNSTTTTTTEAAPVAPAEPAPVAAAPVADTSTTVADSTPAPRADRN